MLDVIALGYALKTIALPPGLNLVSALGGWLIRFKFRRCGGFVVFLSILSLYVFSTPFFSMWFASTVEPEAPLQAQPISAFKAEAIVILAGGRAHAAREYNDRDTVSAATLTRLRYGAIIHRSSKLPIAVIGGKVFLDDAISEAALMKSVLKYEFNVDVTWLEEQSRNTADNATEARKLLPVTRIILVTHATHFMRARPAFEQAGFEVLAAPVEFKSPKEFARVWQDWLPRVSALNTTASVLHEYIGVLWYRWRYGIRWGTGA